ncbi:MAG: alpha/beta hydrolase [candidate division SR1 bacterium]|nr:alpha/beta hydrolase [candidate division SR1 bacterium]
MQSVIKLITSDKYSVYATLDKIPMADNLIIMVHGLSGSSEEHIFVNGAKFFNQQGYDVVRIDFYSEKEGARKLSETNVSEHSDDLILLVKYFQNTYKKIFLIGHSLGGLTILRKDIPNIQGTILRDPSLYPSSEGEYTFDETKNMFLLDRGENLYISPHMIKERTQDKTEMLSQYHLPTKVIFASEESLKDQRVSIKSSLKFPGEFVTINGASHCFDETGTEEKLFEETIEWLKKQ